MKLFAKKPCSFGGKRFAIGDEIPVDLVVNPTAQAKMDVLSIVNDAPAMDPGDPAGDCTVVALVIHTKDGDVSLELSPESIQTVMDVLTANADDAAELIKQITSDDILFLVNAADSRKTVQAAAKARAQDLMEAQEGEESAGDQ